MKRILCFAIALFCFSVSQAYASFHFDFNSDLFKISGQLLTVSNGDGSFRVTDGYALDTGALNKNLSFNISSGSGNNGVFIYDNLLFPESKSLLTATGGLLFKSSDGTTQLNIWASGKGDYVAMEYVKGSYNPKVDWSSLTYGGSVGAFSITSTPIPTTVWLLGVGLLGLVGIRRKFNK
jgi:hypothetical protein